MNDAFDHRGALPQKPTHVPTDVVLGVPWRIGRKLGRTMYVQFHGEPCDSDPLIGVMDDAKVAAHIVAMHNIHVAAHNPKGLVP